MDEVELLVAGGGFAGLCCATAAAARGVDTLVLDKQPAPGHNVHTTGILVKEVADAWDIPRALTHKIHGVRLYSPALRTIDLQSPGYYFQATDTRALLAWLERQTREAGAKIKHRARFLGCAPRTGATRRATVKTGGGECGVGFKYLVGCDGARSQVAKSMCLGRNKAFLRGVELEFDGVTRLDRDLLHVFIDSELAPGYIAWVVPGVAVTQVGLAVRYPATPNIRQFLNKITYLFDFTQATIASKRGGLIPCGGVVSPFARDDVMLIGDAAGMVSPLTAGGIHNAMAIGRAAGIALSNHLLDGEPDPLRVLERDVPSFFFKQMLRAGFDRPLPNRVYEHLLQSRAFRAAAQNIFFHHRGLFSMRAWRDMVWNDAGRETLLG